MFEKNHLLVIPGPKDCVWQKIASSLTAKYGTKITNSSIRVRVACNRNDLKCKLGLLPPVSSANAICSPQDTDSGNSIIVIVNILLVYNYCILLLLFIISY